MEQTSCVMPCDDAALQTGVVLCSVCCFAVAQTTFNCCIVTSKSWLAAAQLKPLWSVSRGRWMRA